MKNKKDFSISTVALTITANGFGLGEVCEALACAVGQIAPNPCYKLAGLFSTNAKSKY